MSPDTVVTAPMTSRSEPAPESLQLVTGQTLGDANAVGADSASNDAMPAQSGRRRDRILEARLIRFMELPSRAKGRFRPHCWRDAQIRENPPNWLGAAMGGRRLQ